MSDLVRWEPFRELRSIRDEMNRVLADTFAKFADDNAARTGFWQPAIDIHQTDTDVVVTADVPGFDNAELDVSMTGDTLTITGEHKEVEDVKDEHYIRRERRYGRFTRSIPLPVEVDAGKATATCKNGALRVVLPKSERARPKSIKLDVHQETS